MSSQESPLRVAIVGGGPKGMYCLERLVSAAAQSDRALAIEVFEPTGEPGPGAVYRAGQPAHLRMNFADELIDAWPPGESIVPSADRHSLTEWLTRTGNDDGVGYAPRSIVGEYLSGCWAAIEFAAPAGVQIRIHQAAVERIEPGETGWLLSAGGEEHAADEVMLAVGHRPAAPGSDGVRAVSYPLSHSLPPGDPAAGDPVTIRGMALTFIDAALELTEGRGGRFAEEPESPGGLRYESSGREPGPITALSRSGRPMLVKAGPGTIVPMERLTAVFEQGRGRIAELDEQGFVAELIVVIADTAAAILALAGGDDLGPGALSALLLERLTPSATPAPVDPAAARAELQLSWEVATGRTAPDPGWALGESWRGLYPALVERGSHGGVPELEWPAFAPLAREMERIAFGPPPVNGAKLLALLEAGQVRLAGPGEDAEAVALDAVTTAPGAVERRDDLVDYLREAELIRSAPGGRRGIEVTPEASCVGAGGAPVRGLAAVGRLTEDWVIGNDTLSRRLHSHPGRWAERVVSG